MKPIPLTEWAKQVEPPPSPRTLRRWVVEGKIFPRPRKFGRSYFALPSARYVDPADPDYLEEVAPAEVPLVERFRAAIAGFSLKSIDELRSLPLVSAKTKCHGLYFLWQDDELIYIGEAAHIRRRCNEHVSVDRKQFTHATYLELPDFGEHSRFTRMHFEREYVRKYKPRLNYDRHG